jgi:hypothetical protein
MSLRSSPERDELDEIGSMFGSSLGISAGGLWNRLSGSPVLRASSSMCLNTPPSISSSMSIEDMLESSLAASLPTPLMPSPASAPAVAHCATASSSPPVVESCIYLEDLPAMDDAKFAFAHFLREDDEVAPFVHAGVTYKNWDPVRPKPIYFERVFWSPVVDADGGEVHCFSFWADECVATLYATLFAHDAAQGMEALERVSLHVDDRTLKFHSPSSHLQKLEALLSGPSESDAFYLPLAEVVVGSAALRASRVLVDEADRSTAAFANAERAWMSTVGALEVISATVVHGCERHNKTEASQHVRVDARG